MPSSSLLPTGLILLLATVLIPAPSPAQPLSDSLRAEALRDFHGPDRTGKDGPLAKAGLDLLLLYHEYRAFRRREGGASFSPSTTDASVSDGYVTIDAIATTSAEQLRADLAALGLTDGAVAGRVVSGRLPIAQVPALAQMGSLRGVVLPRAKTQERNGPPRPRPQRSVQRSPSLPSDGSNPGRPLFLGVALGALLLAEEA